MRTLVMAKDKRIKDEDHFTSGNVAVAEGAIAAGMGGFFGYPITPSSSIMEHVVKRFSQLPDKATFLQVEDEIAAITATMGSSWTRVKSMTATSGPGFSLMQEGIGLAAFTETPLVLVNVMRGGPSTGLPTFPGQQELMQSHFGSHGDYLIPTLAPASVQECFDLTFEAFNIAEALRTPVFVLSDQVLSTLKERYTIPPPDELEIIDRAGADENTTLIWKGEEISSDDVQPMNCFGEKKKAFSTGLSHDDTGHVDLSPDTYERLLTRLNRKIIKYQHLLPQPEVFHAEDAEVIVVAYGSAARSVKAAIRLACRKSLNVGLFRPKTIWPFPAEKLREVAKDKKVLVVEISSGQLIWPVERYLRREVHHLPFLRGSVPPPSKILTRIVEVSLS